MESPFDSCNDVLAAAIEKFRVFERICRKVIEDGKLAPSDHFLTGVKPKDFTQSLQDTAEALSHVEKAFRECRSQTKALLSNVRAQAEVEARDDRPVFKIDIPMEFTEKNMPHSIPRDFHISFLNDRRRACRCPEAG